VLHAAAHMPPEPRTCNSKLPEAESQWRAAVLAAAEDIRQQSNKRAKQGEGADAPADLQEDSDGEAAIPDSMLHLPASTTPGVVPLVQPEVPAVVPTVVYEAGAPAVAAASCQAAPKPKTSFKVKVRCWAAQHWMY
jgi:hypothetical protein